MFPVKKIARLFFILLFLFATVNVSIGSHYCCGNLKSLSFFTTPSPCCLNEEDSSSENRVSISEFCCQTILQILETDDYSNSVVSIQKLKVTPLALSTLIGNNADRGFYNISFEYRPPPLLNSISRTILFQVFRI